MPAIKPRTTQKHFVGHVTPLYRKNNRDAVLDDAFIGESWAVCPALEARPTCRSILCGSPKGRVDLYTVSKPTTFCDTPD